MFRVGSISKQFTSVAILILQDQRLLSVEEPIGKYLPNFPNGGEITIHHLLCHMSGLPNFFQRPDGENQLVLQNSDFLKGQVETNPPGISFEYNNTNYLILAAIIERVTGRTYAEYLETTFFKPLSMNRTTVDMGISPIAGQAVGYIQENNEYIEAPYIDMSIAIGSGNIVSCIEDLSLWNIALHQQDVLSANAYSQLVQEHARSEKKGVAYGYGLFLKHPKFPNENSIGHFGKINGFLSAMLYEPDRDRTTIILSNSENAPLPEILQDISSGAGSLWKKVL